MTVIPNTGWGIFAGLVLIVLVCNSAKTILFPLKSYYSKKENDLLFPSLHRYKQYNSHKNVHMYMSHLPVSVFLIKCSTYQTKVTLYKEKITEIAKKNFHQS